MTVAVREWSEPDAPIGLGVWAAEARSAAELAASFALTAFVPDSLRVVDKRTGVVDEQATTATITAALLTGRELGLSPMAALRSIDVVSGTPALRAHLARALVLARGHDLWLVESTSTRCIYRGRRSDSTHVQEVTWTIDRARGLGIANRPNWRAQPTAMLVARASAEIARLVAPEALLGLPYVVEELDERTELAGEDPADEDKPPARKRTARRKVRPLVDAQLPPSPDTPAPEPTPPHDEQQPEPVPEVTPEQLKALHTAMSVAGIDDRADRLAYVSGVIARDVSSSKELTRAEASAVLDAIADMMRQREADLSGLADDSWPDDGWPDDEPDGSEE